MNVASFDYIFWKYLKEKEKHYLVICMNPIFYHVCIRIVKPTYLLYQFCPK